MTIAKFLQMLAKHKGEFWMDGIGQIRHRTIKAEVGFVPTRPCTVCPILAVECFVRDSKITGYSNGEYDYVARWYLNMSRAVATDITAAADNECRTDMQKWLRKQILHAIELQEVRKKTKGTFNNPITEKDL